jgi:hypothetical protein
MNSTEQDWQVFYAQPGPMTDPGDYARLFEGLPMDVGTLCQVVQNLVIHVFWAERYGVTLPEPRKQEVQLRTVRQKLDRMMELEPAPLTAPRPLDRRLVQNCRDISVLLCAMLRFQGVPARARCGFGTYFMPNHFEDHWVCQYWHALEQRWVMVDGQLDKLQRQVLKIDFDPLDMPPGRFIPAGQAWQMARSGKADPNQFGIFQWHGLNFIRGNLLRDLAALNKHEVLPWDSWGLLKKRFSQGYTAQLAYLDLLANLTLQENDAFSQVRSTYTRDLDLRVPSTWLQ